MHDKRAEDLGCLDNRLVDLGADNLELREAMQAGAAALKSLESVRAELRSAEDFVISDELGSVFEATKAQLSRIDTASQHAHAAKRLIQKFQ